MRVCTYVICVALHPNSFVSLIIAQRHLFNSKFKKVSFPAQLHHGPVIMICSISGLLSISFFILATKR